MKHVWLVWTESGKYENYSRDCEGVFASEELANEFASAVEGKVERCEALAEMPQRVTVHRWADHIAPDGSLSPGNPERLGMQGPGFGRARDEYPGWSHQTAPVHQSSLNTWSGKYKPDLYVEVEGNDLEAVQAEYHRLVATARARLLSSLTADAMGRLDELLGGK